LTREGENVPLPLIFGAKKKINWNDKPKRSTYIFKKDLEKAMDKMAELVNEEGWNIGGERRGLLQANAGNAGCDRRNEKRNKADGETKKHRDGSDEQPAESVQGGTDSEDIEG
jgi:hypothetical protein